MTEKQTNALVKNPNTKKAIATLQKFAKMEAQYKALEKEAKEANKQLVAAMQENGIVKINIDTNGLTGFITLATKNTFSAEDLDEVSDDFKKLALDNDKVKAHATLTGDLPDGIVQKQIYYIIKKFQIEGKK